MTQASSTTTSKTGKPATNHNFISISLIIDNMGGALNKGGDGQIKQLSRGNQSYAYASPQNYRYGLRQTAELLFGETMSPIVDNDKSTAAGRSVSTSGDAVKYWDDDLFGYMGKDTSAKGKKGAQEQVKEPGDEGEPVAPGEGEDAKGDGGDGKMLTRISPLRTSLMIAMERGNLKADTLTMNRVNDSASWRENGEKVHSGYMQGVLNLSLSEAGRIFAGLRSGLKNISPSNFDAKSGEAAPGSNLAARLEQGELQHHHVVTGKSLPMSVYTLPTQERLRRIGVLLKSVPMTVTGAHQTLGYADTTPRVTISCVVHGGSSPLHGLVTCQGGVLKVDQNAAERTSRSWKSYLRSPVYIGVDPRLDLSPFEALTQGLRDGGAEAVLSTPLEAAEALEQFLIANPDLIE